MTDNKKIKLVIGSKVYSNLYGGRFGFIFNVHKYKKAVPIKSLASVVQSGGTADYDIVFENGTISHKVPECIVRGVQWTLFTELISLSQLNDLLENAKTVKLQAEAKKKADTDKFNQDVKEFKSSVEFKDLVQGDCSSGVLAGKNIRKLLKDKVPNVKFSVSKRHYGSVSVSAEGLIAEQIEEVKNIIRMFKSGYYDIHEDIHRTSSSPFQTVFGSADYITLY